MMYPERAVKNGIFRERNEGLDGALGAYIGPGSPPPVHAYRDGVLGEYFKGGGIADASQYRDGIFGGPLGAMHVPGLGADPSETDTWVALGIGVLLRGALGALVGYAVSPHGQETGWAIGGAVATGLLGVLGAGGVAGVALATRRG